MTQPISIISLFCEDIRQEQSGVDTLVGVMPDELNLPNIPSAIPKLAIYTRINFPVDFNPGEITISIDIEGNEEVQLTTLDKKFVVKSIHESTQRKSPLVGLISRAVSSPYFVKQAGRVRILTRYNAMTVISGTLNIQIASDKKII